MQHAVITGPIGGTPTIGLVGVPRTLAKGYVEEEWLLAGNATAFVAAGSLGDDGVWDVVPGDAAEYRTRCVVRRPVDLTQHNGTVVVEWLNVSGGIDADADWREMHRHLTRAGFAWVGVSAQRVGIEGGGFVPGACLKEADPERYGSLVHPGDRFSFDIFTQAGQAVREGLGSLRAERVLATGASQSAMCLTTYIDAIEPLARVYDGYLLHSRPGAAGGLDGPVIPAPGDDLGVAMDALPSQAVRIRDDHTAPVLILQSETDLMTLGYLPARQSDTDLLRLWEIAGAAHADTYLLVAGAEHDDDTTIDELARLCAPTSTPLGPEFGEAETPINAGPQHHYIAQAAIAGLDRWVKDGTLPAASPRLEVAETPPELVRDQHGIARGGIRTGFVDVPTATLSGLGQEGSILAFLFGTTRPFDAATLAELYPGGRSDFAHRFADATDQAVRAGFVLAEDAAEMNALALAMYPE